MVLNVISGVARILDSNYTLYLDLDDEMTMFNQCVTLQLIKNYTVVN